ncbi:ribonuclease P protein component [Natronospira bacteriovora]|uniref:Ribonuclease P protein component n=1 Tax=Natronospira bacteriovora TaxID=3069753 RepID=A0ABU0W6X7_9GAMM|nr:ribonuclease P protein component [Natronospira sp. AB-CW4]MDQ2069756.1 ribonuclease P protein component [Natronospira sp. AB-CW4]
MAVPGERGFPPCVRLNQGDDFRQVFRRGKRSKDRFFTILARTNGLDQARLGMAISRRHSGSAVTRNRLKRLVRESFRHHKAQLAGLDIVVMSQPQASRADNAQLFESLTHHWQRLMKQCAPSSSS